MREWFTTTRSRDFGSVGAGPDQAVALGGLGGEGAPATKASGAPRMPVTPASFARDHPP
jgi:hypothetical protein